MFSYKSFAVIKFGRDEKSMKFFGFSSTAAMEKVMRTAISALSLEVESKRQGYGVPTEIQVVR